MFSALERRLFRSAWGPNTPSMKFLPSLFSATAMAGRLALANDYWKSYYYPTNSKIV